MIHWKSLAAAALAATVLGGCAYPRGPADYAAYTEGAEQNVRYGVVETVRDSRLQGPQSGVGAATGAMVGSVAGGHVGGGSGQIVGAIFGMLLGGVVGNEMERAATDRPGLELTVLLDSGRYIAVVQDAAEPFRTGDRVRVLSSRGLTRVTH